VGVLCLDLDGFKQINDTYGHDAGDEVGVLVVTARRLAAQVRPEDTAARLGGDEFAVTAPRITTAGLMGLAQRVTIALAAPHLIHGHSIVVAASVGSHLSGAGDGVADALRQADQAMYEVKRSRTTTA
jgi:diguanylate cyclase (GGDEF)-like protein